jgi:cytochrome c oxidase cbb3-type subunit 3
VPRLRRRGSKGFPNLTDNDWLGGDTHDYIVKTVMARPHRHDAADGRRRGHAEDVKNVANYVLSLSGSPHN